MMVGKVLHCSLERATAPACSYWGEALKWGPQHMLDSAEACCQACLDYKPASEDDMDCNGEYLIFLAIRMHL